MLKPIPPQLLRHTATVHIPSGIDENHEPTGVENLFMLRCCIQRESRTAKTRDNTPVNLSGTMFVDAHLTIPRLDWMSVKRRVDNAGGSITVDYADETYTVATVDECLDNRGKVHHYELGLL